MGLVQRRRIVFVALTTICVILVLLLLNPSIPHSYVHRTTFSQTTKNHEDESRIKHPWTRLVSGVDGFYVFENVHVKDRQLCKLKPSWQFTMSNSSLFQLWFRTRKTLRCRNSRRLSPRSCTKTTLVIQTRTMSRLRIDYSQAKMTTTVITLKYRVCGFSRV